MGAWRAVAMPAAMARPSCHFLAVSGSTGLHTKNYSYSTLHCRFGNSCVRRKRMFIYAASASWTARTSPYQILELDTSAREEDIKTAYRRLAKQYHPDVYDGTGNLEEGETSEVRFIKIQAAYELLMDREQRISYDRDNRTNPNKANKAWMEWMMKKKKAFEQRGDLAATAWAEQQQRELNIRVRQLSRSKNDPEELRKILARERKATIENTNATMKRHNLVLKRRELLRRKSEAEKKNNLQKLLESEGLELDSDDEDDGTE